LVPSGRNRVTGLRFAEEALWQLASGSNDRVLIEAYLSRFPNGRHVAAARRLLGNPAEQDERSIGLTDEARRVIQRNLTILGYDTRGIDGIFGPATRGAIKRWQQSRDLEATGYLKQPQLAMLRGDASRRREEIRAAEWQRKRADTAFWQQTGKNNTKAGLVRYLQRYPNGVHSRQANRMLNQIRNREAASARQEDRAAWQRARDINTIPAYRQYLQTYRQGAFRDRAEERIEELRRAEQRQARRAAYRAEEQDLELSRASVRTLERRLDRLDFEPGPADGEITRDTRRAIRQFQSSQELDVTGFFNARTVRRLLAVTDDD
ncbi:MAG: peptidoglycan-binding domain-containing protein, partial [Pseudomonadota bacterium]